MASGVSIAGFSGAAPAWPESGNVATIRPGVERAGAGPDARASAASARAPAGWPRLGRIVSPEPGIESATCEPRPLEGSKSGRRVTVGVGFVTAQPPRQGAITSAIQHQPVRERSRSRRAKTVPFRDQTSLHPPVITTNVVKPGDAISARQTITDTAEHVESTRSAVRHETVKRPGMGGAIVAGYSVTLRWRSRSCRGSTVPGAPVIRSVPRAVLGKAMQSRMLVRPP